MTRRGIIILFTALTLGLAATVAAAVAILANGTDQAAAPPTSAATAGPASSPAHSPDGDSLGQSACRDYATDHTWDIIDPDFQSLLATGGAAAQDAVNAWLRDLYRNAATARASSVDAIADRGDAIATRMETDPGDDLGALYGDIERHMQDLLAACHDVGYITDDELKGAVLK